MGIRFDLVTSTIIAGFIILILFGINTFMMETSVDKRLFHEMQTFADNTAILIQNELRTLDSIESLTDSTIRFVTTQKDTVGIYPEGRNLYIERTNGITSTTTTKEYASRLLSLTFTPKGTNNEEALSIANTAIIHIRVITETMPEQHVGGENDSIIRAYSEKQVYLRNVFYE